MSSKRMSSATSQGKLDAFECIGSLKNDYKSIPPPINVSVAGKSVVNLSQKLPTGKQMIFKI